MEEKITILENWKYENQRIMAEKLKIIEKLKSDATMEGVSGCLSVTSADRIGETVFDMNARHRVLLKDLTDRIASQNQEMLILIDENHALNLRVMEMDRLNLIFKQEQNKKSVFCSPVNVQSVSTLGGESSGANKVTAGESHISGLNMSVHLHNISGSATKVSNDTTGPSESEGNHSSNLEAVRNLVGEVSTDMMKNADRNPDRTETSDISTRDTKNTTDANSVMVPQDIEQSKDVMAHETSKDRLSSDATDSSQNMNMPDKAKENGKEVENDIAPSGSVTDPVQIYESVLPTPVVLNHVVKELEWVNKRLKKSNENKNNNASSSVLDTTVDDGIEEEVNHEVHNADVVRVTEEFGNYYVGDQLLSDFRYPKGVKADVENDYPNLRPDRHGEDLKLLVYVINMRYLMTIGPDHKHFHLKSIYYMRCAQMKHDYFYSALKLIGFDDSVILHKLDWEKDVRNTYHDDEQNDQVHPRYIQNNHESFLFCNCETVHHALDTESVSHHNYYDFSLQHMYHEDVDFTSAPTFVNEEKGKVYSTVISPTEKIMHKSCGFFDLVREFFGLNNIAFYTNPNPSPADFSKLSPCELNNVLYMMKFTHRHYLMFSDLSNQNMVGQTGTSSDFFRMPEYYTAFDIMKSEQKVLLEHFLSSCRAKWNDDFDIYRMTVWFMSLCHNDRLLTAMCVDDGKYQAFNCPIRNIRENTKDHPCVSTWGLVWDLKDTLFEGIDLPCEKSNKMSQSAMKTHCQTINEGIDKLHLSLAMFIDIVEKHVIGSQEYIDVYGEPKKQVKKTRKRKTSTKG